MPRPFDVFTGPRNYDAAVARLAGVEAMARRLRQRIESATELETDHLRQRSMLEALCAEVEGAAKALGYVEP